MNLSGNRISKKTVRLLIALIIIPLILWAVYCLWLTPTKILIVNALPARQSDIRLNNDLNSVKLSFCKPQEIKDFSGYDAILLFGRNLYLDSLQLENIEKVKDKGVPIYTYWSRNQEFNICENLSEEQVATIGAYIDNACSSNYNNLLKYLASITGNKQASASIQAPIILPQSMYYHLENGKYFEEPDSLRNYLIKKNLFNEKGHSIALISGIQFPVEHNRPYIDSLILQLTRDGHNVFPMAARGEKRMEMLKKLMPDAVIYLPMGKFGTDSLSIWLSKNNIPLFTPFPILTSHEEWLDKDKPVSGGVLNARIVIPEIDGGIYPLCIATQNSMADSIVMTIPESERMLSFRRLIAKHLFLKEKKNKDKRVAIGFFRSPGHDALLASGMEVIPSLYKFLLRLKAEGYNLEGLPNTEETFANEIKTQGIVLGDYAPAAQTHFMNENAKVWVGKDKYEEWASELLPKEKYLEVVDKYGIAPGNQLGRGDSIAMACLKYGNILLFPQPRPALGNDDFKIVHGMDVPPPHSYLSPYFYIKKEFDADALIHFGTHGNLEFTPGKNAALSLNDWAESLIADLPHFYLYTTGNVGEAIIAKRRSHAVIVSHLTPPFVESGMRQKYASLIEDLHDAIANPARNTNLLKRRIIESGLHKDLELDSVPTGIYTTDDLMKTDSFVEELANEKITGAYYVLGNPYFGEDLKNTVLAICADKIAYNRARKDFEIGLITKSQLQDYSYIAHHYLPAARKEIINVLSERIKDIPSDMKEVLDFRDKLLKSPQDEIQTMINLLNGGQAEPVAGGDPVLNPNVLPTGRNMYSINVENTPGEKAWTDGIALAEETLSNYLKSHGEYPKKVSFTFWAGEFISSQGTTVAQALRMLGIEPVKDSQGRVVDLRLTPSKELGRPRVNILVQVSGQLRDIASSRLKMLTDAVALAANAEDDIYPNYVAEGSLEQEKELVEKGESPKRARELSNMRVFGPVNSGYSTGMLRFTESSGEWDDREELVEGYLNNMCAMYGDDENWGGMDKKLFRAAITGTDVIVQPRQSNTWGPISLDHVYEFTGALSLASTSINGKEPEAVLADYRNSYLPRMQDTREAIAIEARATILNPEFIKARMKGDATTAQMFGEIFRNIFGWSATRSSALPEDIYDDLYRQYILDKDGLGIEEYFGKVNPAALQEMTATMLESARKGFWKADKEKLELTASLNARLTAQHGAPCTDFVCANKKLQDFIASNLDKKDAERFADDIAEATAARSDAKVLKEEGKKLFPDVSETDASTTVLLVLSVVVFIVVILAVIRKRRRQ